MAEFDWTKGVIPCTTGEGPYHPAMQNNRTVWYWPNITYPVQSEAQARAVDILADAIEAANMVVADWNIYRADGG